MCVYLRGKPSPCIAHVELVMNFIARKPPEGRVAKEKAGEKHISFEKVLPPPLQMLE